MDLKQGVRDLRKHLLLGLWLSAIMAAPAAAQQVSCVSLERFGQVTFAAADNNNDGVIDEAEFAGDIAAGFAALDSNHDGWLDPSDLPEVSRDVFVQLDVDRDGRLSFAEVMRQKMVQFRRADTNQDGFLTVEETLRFNAAQSSGC